MQTFTDNYVLKITSPDLMCVEYEKHKRAYDIGISSGLFKVPKILEYDQEKGSLMMENINKIKNLDTILAPSVDLIDRVAKSLATIHENLILPKSMIKTVPKQIEFKDNVFLHGDFNERNICLDTNDNTIVILDWQMTNMYGGQATYGTRLFDLLWFATYSLWQPKANDIYMQRTIKLANKFINTYMHECNAEFNNVDLFDYALKLFNCEMEKRQSPNSFKKYLLHKFGKQLNLLFLKKLNQNKKLTI